MTPELSGAGAAGRVRSGHVRRKAIVYVRQSTPGQVERNRESTALQYGLTRRASQLGWAAVSTTVIDDDLGVSARQAGTRPGFMTLVAEVSLGQVGIVISSEVSRLARNLSEWGRLLEICGHNDTLIADAESLYDLRRPNDRFLLGIKGTVSEAEIHTLRQRMHAGREAKAARGALSVPLPRGYARDASGRVILDPDASVRARIRGVFRTFSRLGSLAATVRALAEDGQGLPVRPAHGRHRGALVWPRPSGGTVHSMLTSPVYAGAFAWGRVPASEAAGLPVDARWRHLLKDQHPGYIDWETFELNQRQLSGSHWPTRARGGGLLSGLLRCGRCGQGMTVTYRGGGGGAGLRYICRGERDYGGAKCQSLSAANLERFASEAAVNALSPASAALSLEALRQAQTGRAEDHEQWRLRIARAERDADEAARAYRAVDPDNRLVAQTLEDGWEAALAECARLKDAYRRHLRRAPATLSAAEQAAVVESASGIAGLWNDGILTQPEKAEIMRLMIERVTVTVVGDSERVQLEALWRGGFRTHAEIRRPVRRLEQLSNFRELCARIAELKSEGAPHAEIAAVLNAEGWKPARRDTFTEASIQAFGRKSRAGLPAGRKRRRQPPAGRGRDEWLIDELAAETGTPAPTIRNWVHKGNLAARRETRADNRPPRWLVQANRNTREAIREWRSLPRREKTSRPAPDFGASLKSS